MNWLTTNIAKRFENPNIDFQVNIIKTNFEKVSFNEAADGVAKSLAGEKIFVGFSGGYDSEFVVRRLHKLQINFVPVLIEHDGLEYERNFAYKTLRELSIEPKVIKITMSDFIRTYYDKIYTKINGTSWPVAQYMACEYAHSQNGIYIDGGHILGDGDDKILEQNFYLPEWDFYCAALFPNMKVCNFFIHTAQIAYATLSEIKDTDLTWADYKERVFGLRYRPKTSHIKSFHPKIRKFLKDLDTFKQYKPKTKVFFGNKESLMNLIST